MFIETPLFYETFPKILKILVARLCIVFTPDKQTDF